MVEWTAAKLRALGAQVELAELGTQTLPDGTKLQLPKAILANLGNVCHNDYHSDHDWGRNRFIKHFEKKLNAYQFSRYQIFHEFLLKPPENLTVVDIIFSINHKYFW